MNLRKFFQSSREKLYSKLNEKKSLRKIVFSSFLTTSYNMEKYVELLKKHHKQKL